MRVQRENSMIGEDKSAECELLHAAEKSMSLRVVQKQIQILILLIYTCGDIGRILN